MAHYWTGFYTSRPNFKKLIRDFTAATLEDDSFFSLEYMYYVYNKNKSELYSFEQIHSKTIKMMNELVATSTHHDTITGTSPSHVIMNETATF